MNKTRKKQTIFMMLLVMICGLFVFTMAKAENTCPYHLEHDENCGYIEAIEGQPCLHEHTEECYKSNLVCTLTQHTHDELCYDENGVLICEVNEHIHGNECYESVLDCHHIHNEECGYQEGTIGHDCTHKCSYCDKTLVREGNISIETLDNQYILHIESTLTGTKGDDQVYFYIQLNKSLLDNLDIHKEDENYKVTTDHSQQLTLTPIYLGNDQENVYLKYEQSYHSTISFDLIFNTDNIDNSYVKLTTASSFNEADQNTLDVVVIGKEAVSEPEFAGISLISLFSNEVSLLSDTDIDFAEYITEITMKYRSNASEAWKDLTSSGYVKQNDSLKFNIEYVLPGGLLSSENRTIVYQLPSNITAVNAESGDVLNDTGDIVGTYVIQSNGHISITFNDKYVEKNAKGQSIKGYISFTSSVNNIKSDMSGKIELPFNEKIEIDLTIEDKVNNTNDLQVTKKASSTTVIGNNQVSYTIEVTSAKGTGSNITLTDSMYNVVATSQSITVQKVFGDRTEIISSAPQFNNELSYFSLELPPLEAGEKYIITYTAKLKDDIFDKLNGDSWTRNYVSVSSTDKDNNKLTDDAYVDVTFRNKLISKMGILSEDGMFITWTVTVNESKNDISGWILDDKLNGQAFKGTVKIVDSSNQVIEESVTLPYTFLNGSNDTYTITYTTSSDRNLGAYYTYNEAILKKGENGSQISTGNIGVGDNKPYNPITKKGNSLNVNGNTATINWTVTINAQYSSIPENWTYSDELYGNQYFTEAQKQNIENTLMSKFGLSDRNLITWEYKNYTIDGQTVSLPYKFTITPVPKSLNRGETINFSYESTALIGDGKTSITFRNSAKINNINADGTQTYIPIVRKLDAQNNQQNDTSHDYYQLNDGILKWKIQVRIPSNVADSIWVIDTLPAGVTLQKDMLQFGIGDQLSNFSIAEDQMTWGNDNSGRVTATIDGNKLNVQLTNQFCNTNEEKICTILVCAKINDDFLWEYDENLKATASFKNCVEVKESDENGNILGSDDQTQKITRDEYYNIIDKTCDRNNIKNNVIPYSIVINPDRKDLIQENDTMILTDRLVYKYNDNVTNGQYRINLVVGSVKVYYRNSDGSKGEQLDVEKTPYTYTEIIGQTPTDGWTTVTNQLEITIPDSTPLIVEYQYRVTGTPNITTQTIFNTASLSGIGGSSSSDSESYQISIKESAAGAVVKGINIYKVDSENNGIFLSNAQFDLYRWSAQDNQYVLAQEDIVSNDEGLITIDNQALAFNTAYKLVETQPPTGYMISKDNYEFYIINADLKTYPMSLPDSFNGEARASGDIVYYPNEKAITEINLEKVWYDINGQLDTTRKGDITIELWQQSIPNPDRSPVESLDDQIYKEPYTLKYDDEWKLTITELPKYSDTDRTYIYHYYVKEIDIEGYKVEYVNNDGIQSGTITIKNTDIGMFVLPETGGINSTTMMVLGIFMMSLGTICFVIKRHFHHKGGESL